MPRGRAATVEQTREVQRLVLEGFSAAQIYRELERLGLLGGDHPDLGRRTVERMVRDFTTADPSEPWSMTDAEEEEAPLVLDVLRFVFRLTEGRVWLSKNLAKWVVRVRKASPTVTAVWAYVLAVLYRAAEERKEDVRCLDLALAARPWEKVEGTAAVLLSVPVAGEAGGDVRHKAITMLSAGPWTEWRQDCHRLGMSEQYWSLTTAWLMSLPDDDSDDSEQSASSGMSGDSRDSTKG